MQLKEWLTLKNLSYRAFALSVNVSTGHMSRIAKGEVIPSFSIASAIKQATKGEVEIRDLGVEDE